MLQVVFSQHSILPLVTWYKKRDFLVFFLFLFDAAFDVFDFLEFLF
jgi:hypothetical protein